METLYRICSTCNGTGDQDTPDGPACTSCQGVGFTPAYVPFNSAMSTVAASYPVVANGQPLNRAVQPPQQQPPYQQPPQQQNAAQGQQQTYQQQAQNYVSGTNNPGPSPRQMQFMEDLAKRIGWQPAALEEHVRILHGVTIPNLTRQQASTVIEDLKNREFAVKTATAGTPVTGPGPDVPF